MHGIEWYWFAIIAAVAQLADGVLGMGFGTISSSVLIAMGVPPQVSSFLVHSSEIFTTGTAGFFHWRLRNIFPRLVGVLTVFGVLGAIIGSLLFRFVPVIIIKVFVSAYLLFLGVSILHKFFRLHKRVIVHRYDYLPLRLIARVMNALRLRRPQPVGKLSTPQIGGLGVLGGLLDAVGGGGWGVVVNSSLIGKGQDPHKSIGSSCIAEFFVSLTVMVTLGQHFSGALPWEPLLALMGGGIVMAPISAWLCKRLPTQQLLLLMGLMVCLMSFFILRSALCTDPLFSGSCSYSVPFSGRDA